MIHHGNGTLPRKNIYVYSTERRYLFLFTQNEFRLYVLTIRYYFISQIVKTLRAQLTIILITDLQPYFSPYVQDQYIATKLVTSTQE